MRRLVLCWFGRHDWVMSKIEDAYPFCRKCGKPM
jgi:hypothetical protein